MIEINTQSYLDAIINIAKNIEEKQSENIKEAAKICADAIAADGVIQVFGSGHSIGFGLEMRDRPGSLVPVHSIISNDFVKSGMYTYEDFSDFDNKFERRPNIAQKFYELYDIRPQDVFIIISNSGINGLVIDLASAAKEKGHKVIVVTSLDHTMSEESRHPSGKKLKDFGDVVIDNCCPRGDAMLEIEGGGKIGSGSSISGVLTAQGIVIEVVNQLLAAKKEVPILVLEENEDDINHNKQLKERYKGRI